MALSAKDPRPSEAGHWYTRDGVPMHTVIGANGKQRDTTLRDARKLNLVPSVTTVIKVMDRPALTIWLQRQVLMAALTLPRVAGEPESDYIERILKDSKEEGKSAADRGTDIHEAIQRYYEGRPIQSPEFADYIEGFDRAVYEKFGKNNWLCEKAFTHELGFGGKLDMHVPGIVLDIKTKEFGPDDKVVAYEDNLMQLAAYRVGINSVSSRCANVFVSRSNPGLVHIHEWPEEEIQRGWEMFRCLLTFWQLKNGHK